ncbi:MAG: cobalt ECF transporter T component CbiQ, partial [Vallitaleaceae bacterium]|nr:cobalt ECF transporter T component CbiQ [Vallitaleaceae bacterium]
MYKSLDHLRFLDELGEQQTLIHKIHPLAKLITTLVFLVSVVSFGKYEISGLLPLLFFIVLMMSLSDTPVLPTIKRMLLAMPLIIGIGLFNPLLDHEPMVFLGNLTISGGWVSFISLMIKGMLTVSAAIVLIATTGMNQIAIALRMLKVPKLFVVQLLLTYRYITILIEEIGRTSLAYSLRSTSVKGVRFKDWGSLLGQLLNRTLDRASRIYTSMCCRGFEGDYKTGQSLKGNLIDFL